MFSAASNDTWFFRYDYSRFIDFCIWVLLQDGLQVAPFTAHSGGDQTLTQAGLQPADWSIWFTAVTNAQDSSRQAVLQQTQPAQGGVSSGAQSIADPTDLWRGNPLVQHHLRQLWQQYLPIAGSRRVWLRALTNQLRDVGHQLWQDLQSYQPNFPSLTVYFVDYTKQTTVVIPPASLICTIVNGSISGDEFMAQIKQAVQRWP